MYIMLNDSAEVSFFFSFLLTLAYACLCALLRHCSLFVLSAGCTPTSVWLPCCSLPQDLEVGQGLVELELEGLLLDSPPPISLQGAVWVQVYGNLDHTCPSKQALIKTVSNKSTACLLFIYFLLYFLFFSNLSNWCRMKCIFEVKHVSASFTTFFSTMFSYACLHTPGRPKSLILSVLNSEVELRM